jgi:hypothetical protein
VTPPRAVGKSNISPTNQALRAYLRQGEYTIKRAPIKTQRESPARLGNGVGHGYANGSGSGPRVLPVESVKKEDVRPDTASSEKPRGSGTSHTYSWVPPDESVREEEVSPAPLRDTSHESPLGLGNSVEHAYGNGYTSFRVPPDESDQGREVRPAPLRPDAPVYTLRIGSGADLEYGNTEISRHRLAPIERVERIVRRPARLSAPSTEYSPRLGNDIDHSHGHIVGPRVAPVEQMKVTVPSLRSASPGSFPRPAYSIEHGSGDNQIGGTGQAPVEHVERMEGRPAQPRTAASESPRSLGKFLDLGYSDSDSDIDEPTTAPVDPVIKEEPRPTSPRTTSPKRPAQTASGFHHDSGESQPSGPQVSPVEQMDRVETTPNLLRNTSPSTLRV